MFVLYPYLILYKKKIYSLLDLLLFTKLIKLLWAKATNLTASIIMLITKRLKKSTILNLLSFTDFDNGINIILIKTYYEGFSSSAIRSHVKTAKNLLESKALPKDEK